MQGTVATFDPQTHTGTLLLDDGTELAFPAAAFQRLRAAAAAAGAAGDVEADRRAP